MNYYLKSPIFPVGAITCIACILVLHSCSPGSDSGTKSGYPENFTLTKSELKEKIRGGWAGQVIGCTFGGPTEFQYCGTMIQQYIPINWNDTLPEWWYTHAPGLYDDIYMDLTFVEVIEREGPDAPALSHAKAFANAGYSLWHANQAARYNILNGTGPPESGFWKNNPHSDDIDFQIEADFAGLMNPGMVNSASEICDRVGHIMNYGDGWYGGVYVAAMYALSFYSSDIGFIVEQALRTIPEGTRFHRCIRDVISIHDRYPDDWRRAWFEVEKNWSADIGCPDGVFDPFNIDAKVNAAYVVIGLLYGEGDFGRTLEISTRCGQDSDCNPATAGGILGTIRGYDGIPGEWKAGIGRVEDMDFRYTTLSLNDVYDMSYRHALLSIASNGGSTDGEEVTIHLQEPGQVAYEQGFTGLYPTRVIERQWEDTFRSLGSATREFSFDFDGKGFVISGQARKTGNSVDKDLNVDIYVDGELLETSVLPTNFLTRKHDIAWNYDLPEGPHRVKAIWTNPEEGYSVDVNRILIYGPEPVSAQ